MILAIQIWWFKNRHKCAGGKRVKKPTAYADMSCDIARVYLECTICGKAISYDRQ